MSTLSRIPFQVVLVPDKTALVFLSIQDGAWPGSGGYFVSFHIIAGVRGKGFSVSSREKGFLPDKKIW